MFYTKMPSLVGELVLVSDGESLTHILWEEDGAPKEAIRRDDLPVLRKTIKQLEEYFNGMRQTFDLPLKLEGTPFQKSVWNELCKIPFGTTISYGELSRRIGNPNASRAVGLANGCNPVAIVVPCHRVIGANGTLTGYGGGLPRKSALLELEQVGTKQLSILSGAC